MPSETDCDSSTVSCKRRGTHLSVQCVYAEHMSGLVDFAPRMAAVEIHPLRCFSVQPWSVARFASIYSPSVTLTRRPTSATINITHHHIHYPTKLPLFNVLCTATVVSISFAPGPYTRRRSDLQAQADAVNDQRCDSMRIRPEKWSAAASRCTNRQTPGISCSRGASPMRSSTWIYAALLTAVSLPA
jgi:hypothetical protein